MSINQRICELIEHEQLSIAAFARKIGIGDQTVRSVCVIRRNKPSFDFLQAIIQTFEWVSAEWLITGKGNMIRKTEESDENSPNLELKPLIDYMRDKDHRIEELIEERTKWKIRYESLINKD